MPFPAFFSVGEAFFSVGEKLIVFIQPSSLSLGCWANLYWSQ